MSIVNLHVFSDKYGFHWDKMRGPIWDDRTYLLKGNLEVSNYSFIDVFLFSDSMAEIWSTKCQCFTFSFFFKTSLALFRALPALLRAFSSRPFSGPPKSYWDKIKPFSLYCLVLKSCNKRNIIIYFFRKARVFISWHFGTESFMCLSGKIRIFYKR